MRCRYLAVLVFVLANACTMHAAPSPDAGANAGAPAPNPYVIQNRSVSHWQQFTPKTASTIYRGITTGPDGNIWFADNNGDALVRTAMTGATKPFHLTFVENGITYSFAPLSPIAGADGKLYVTTDGTDPKNGAGAIGVLTTSGSFHIHDSPSKDNLGDNGLAVGPDGNVWFAEMRHIAKIDQTGVVTEYPYPSGTVHNYSAGVVTGPDHNVWFTDYFSLEVDKIDPTTGIITPFDVSAAGCSGPQGLAVGTDGDLYFNCTATSIAKMTTAGAVTPIANPYGTALQPQDLVQGPNGHIWLTTGSNTLAEYNEKSGVLTGHASPFTTQGLMINLTGGPDENVWAADNGGHIEIYELVTLKVTPSALTFTGVGQTQTITATYKGPGTLTASSGSTAVATVAPGQAAGTFDVTSQGAGKTTITVSDGIGNLFKVRVTVQ
jgi:virginiamycin B lyase